MTQYLQRLGRAVPTDGAAGLTQPAFQAPGVEAVRLIMAPGCRPIGIRGALLGGLVACAAVLGCGGKAYAQLNTRALLSSGMGVPGHVGFVFGPFSNLAMNEAKEIVFLSTLRSPRSELRAVVRSTGVTFSVVAFQGLRSPVAKTAYASFSAPTINNAGVVAFTVVLKDDVPMSAVIRVESGTGRAVAVSGGTVPGNPGATFQEFSAPLIDSAGNILFGARVGGAKPETGLFLWTMQGIRSLAVPAPTGLGPTDLLEPIFFGHDEAVFVKRGVSPQLALEQFFRAAAIRSFQDLKPPPEASETMEVLPARPGEAPIKMLLVLMEGSNVQTAAIDGDPAQPVKARRPPGAVLQSLGRIQGQAAAPRDNIIVAAGTVEQETALALYCLCDGQLMRLTAPEEFLPIMQFAEGKLILSLASDSQHTVGFIAPLDQTGDANAIYVTSLP